MQAGPQQRPSDPGLPKPRQDATDAFDCSPIAGGPSPYMSNPDLVTLRTADLLEKLAGEMDRLTGLIGTVERALPSILASRSSPATTETLAALQGLDLIGQTVASLSGFLRAVTPVGQDDQLHVGAGLRTLTLLDLSTRLGTVEPAASDAKAREDRGKPDAGAKAMDGPFFDLELF
jgi:hypothetical protein